MGIRKVEPEMEFMIIGTLLLEVISHQCNCDNCQNNRNGAFAALVWLISKTQRVDVRHETHIVEGDEGGDEEEVDKPSPSDLDFRNEMLRSINRALNAADVPPAAKGDLADWIRKKMDEVGRGRSS